MRLDAPGSGRFLQAHSLGLSFAGGEANVAVALAHWGLTSCLVSKVPAHDLGTACLQSYRKHGVDTSFVARGGSRLGIFFVENGTTQRGPQVIYDRAGSSFTQVSPNDFDWPRILEGANWFHFTGTAPALGTQVNAALREALEHCRQHGITVSFDVSYRSALWSVEEAGETFRKLLPFVDVLIGSEQDARQFFGVDLSNDSKSTPETREASLRSLQAKYGFRAILFSDRTVSDIGHHFFAASLLMGEPSLVQDGGKQHPVVVHTPSVEIIPVDRIGTGDALAAGLIRGLLLGHSPQATLDFALAAAVLKHTIPGDFALASVAEINHFASGQPLTRIRR
jgi:2-dehydro-3-deoxygluconokinase